MKTWFMGAVCECVDISKVSVFYVNVNRSFNNINYLFLCIHFKKLPFTHVPCKLKNIVNRYSVLFKELKVFVFVLLNSCNFIFIVFCC